MFNLYIWEIELPIKLGGKNISISNYFDIVLKVLIYRYKNRWKNIDISIFLNVNLGKILKFREKTIPMCTELVYNKNGKLFW